MKKTDSMKEALLVRKMRSEDPIELPMDDLFFDKLHQNIMTAVDKTEIKHVKKWQKTWVFLERGAEPYRAKARKAVKLGLAAVTFSLGLSLLSASINLLQQAEIARLEINKKTILTEAEKNPLAWSELIANYQSENDFYADILSQKEIKTIVQIDQRFTQSL